MGGIDLRPMIAHRPQSAGHPSSPKRFGNILTAGEPVVVILLAYTLTMPRNQIQKSLFALLLGSMLLAGCGVLNPFCGSARPKPVLTSLAPNPASLAQVQQGLLLTVNGSNFYSSSRVVWNGAVLHTTVVSSTQLQAQITTAQISSPGTAQIIVHTPANLSGDLGCDSGGDSTALTFTVT